MKELFDYYTQELEKNKTQVNRLKGRLRLLATVRLAVFFCAFSLGLVFRSTPLIVLPIAVVGLTVFLWLVKTYENAKTALRFFKELVKINEEELRVLHYDLEGLETGAEYIDPEHAYSNDLDLFGEKSFFQYLNRTGLTKGRALLAALVCKNDCDAITAKQETVDELSQRPEWRHYFLAQAKLVDEETDLDAVVDWLKGYRPFVPNIFHWLPWVFFSLFIVLTMLIMVMDLPLDYIGYLVLIGLGITARSYRQISRLARRADQVKSIFKQYSLLLQHIENADFQAPQLRFQQQRLKTTDGFASTCMTRFSKLLDIMDYNNNIFYIVLGNGTFLGALWSAFRIETWIRRYGHQVESWFEVIAFFDAHVSLGNFAFNHPRYVYPILHDGPEVLKCTDLGHPLIRPEHSVNNPVTIGDTHFLIITGSNMAGKSTYLRSVGLSLVMANLGLPVCAHTYFYRPVKLITSMRSIDALHKGDSYFMAELKRLRKVVDHLVHDAHFVLLDEILKGTNSTDKANGSKRFVQKLVNMGATGIIATHDLSLCDIADDLPNVGNYHFDASIKDNELYFDYRLKEGVSQTMNASFLLEKMDLV